MIGKKREHIVSLIVVLLLFLILYPFIDASSDGKDIINDQLIVYLEKMDSLDLDNEIKMKLLDESIEYIYKEDSTKKDSLLSLIGEYRTRKIYSAPGKNSLNEESLKNGKLISLFWMYIKFIMIYLIVLMLTYYGSQTIALYRFVKMNQKNMPHIEALGKLLVLSVTDKNFFRAADNYKRLFQIVFKIISTALIYLVLFAPAYVIAYSFRTEIKTDSLFFVIILGTISNGLLINYSNRFFTLLHSESGKGYVLTAKMKNLLSSYDNKTLPITSIFKLNKKFKGHILEHIFINARFQYILAVKEQAAFLITGLIIIEMALNIHGHLCYELLQNLLFKNYDIVLLIIGGIFGIVKFTDLAVESWFDHENKKYK